jgi:hypothetical protein
MKPMKMRALSLLEVQEAARLRPRGYLADVLAPPARIHAGRVVLPLHRLSALRLRYARARPGLWQAACGLFRELARWKAAGFRITHWRAFLARSRACRRCPFSFGRIVARCGRCGCTRAKLLLATARCPEKRWPV